MDGLWTCASAAAVPRDLNTFPTFPSAEALGYFRLPLRGWILGPFPNPLQEIGVGYSLRQCYSTPAMAASTASMSAPTSRPSEAAPAPGEIFEQPGPLAWHSLGSLPMLSLRSRMPAASGELTTKFPLGKVPRWLMIRFFSNL